VGQLEREAKRTASELWFWFTATLILLAWPAFSFTGLGWWRWLIEGLWLPVGIGLLAFLIHIQSQARKGR
jgi:hypothetical protein